MGIKNFYNFIVSNTCTAVTHKPTNSYIGQTLGIDVYNILYQIGIGIRNTKDLKNTSGESTALLNGFLVKIHYILNLGIKPIFVFDGKAPNIKSHTLKKRQKLRNDAIKKHSESLSDIEKKKWYKRSYKLNNQEIYDCKKLLDLLGIPYIQAYGEADPVLAALSMTGKIDGIVSEDVDILIFGGQNIIKNFNKKGNTIQINLNKVLDELNLTHTQLVYLSILLGSDYCPSIKGIGCVSAYKGILKYKTLTNFIKNTKKYSVSNDFIACSNSAFEYFTNASTIDPNDPMIDFNLKILIKENVKTFLCKEKNFNENRINSILTNIETAKHHIDHKIWSYFNK